MHLLKEAKEVIRKKMREKSKKRSNQGVRRANGVKVKKRYTKSIMAVKVSRSTTANTYEGRMEVDSHADTFVAGRNCVVMHYTERVADVLPYSDEYKAKTGIPIAQVATGHTNLAGQRSILVVNEALWMPELPYSLFNPNQFREYGVVVQDNC